MGQETLIVAYVFVAALLFTLVGKAALRFARVELDERENFVAPAIGVSILIYACTTLNLFGFAIGSFALALVLGAALISFLYLLFVARLSAFDILRSSALPLVVVAVLLALVGNGFFKFGPHWQGLVNEDAATNSLGAQYFLSHGFFDLFDPTTILNGTDYSPIASALYVAAGHRFGDVMLLALAAALASMPPDKIYMAHALTIHVAMICACASLACLGRFPLRFAWVAVGALTLSAVANYAFLNQLISQTGGIMCLVVILVLWRNHLDVAIAKKGVSWPHVALLAIVVAALLRYYPEILTIVGLAGLVLTGLRLRETAKAHVKTVIASTLATMCLVIVFSNVALPMSLTHLMNSLQSGGRSLEHIRNSFDYAFTPEVFPLLLGVVRWREALADPWATLSVAGSFLMLVAIAVKLWTSRFRFAELASAIFAMAIALVYLFLKREEFGSYKILMIFSPFICIAIAILVAESISWRKSVFAVAGLVFMSANARASLSYANASTNDVNPISFLARGQLLDEFQSIAAANDGLILQPQSMLLQRFLELRQPLTNSHLGNGADAASVHQLQNYFLKFGVVFPAENTARDAGVSWQVQAHFETPLSKYFDLVARGLSDSFRKGAEIIHAEKSRISRRAEFACGVKPSSVTTFFISTQQVSGSHKQELFAGGGIQPFNREELRGTLFHLRGQSQSTHAPLLKQFETSRGGWEVSRDMSIAEKSIYFPELDPARPGETMSAVGRYILVEAVGGGGRPQSLRLSFTRSFFGGEKSVLPSITINGATPYELQLHGSGSIDITTDPIAPCVMEGRSFFLVDFGVAPESFESPRPLAYRVLGQRYKPDNRATVGFLRDLSVVRSSADAVSFVPSWAKLRKAGLGGYVGVYEDGWLSQDSRFVLFATPSDTYATFLIEIDPSLVGQVIGKANLSVVDQHGKTLQEIALAAGQHSIKIPFAGANMLDVRLTSNAEMKLPNDGRKTNGRLISVTMD